MGRPTRFDTGCVLQGQVETHQTFNFIPFSSVPRDLSFRLLFTQAIHVLTLDSCPLLKFYSKVCWFYFILLDTLSL